MKKDSYLHRIGGIIVAVVVCGYFLGCNRIEATKNNTGRTTSAITESSSEVMSASTEGKTAEPVTDPTTGNITEPVTDPTTGNVTEPVTDPTTGNITEPVTEPITGNITEPTPVPVFQPELYKPTLSDLNIVDVSKQLYTYEEMQADLKELAALYPDHISLTSLGVTRDKREIYLIRLGAKDAQNTILVQAAIHAREYMTTLLTMKQLEHYLYYYETGHYEGVPYSGLFGQTAVYLIPMLNPDGVTISQLGLEGIASESIRKEVKAWYDRDKKAGITSADIEEYLERFKANANGVDLNRNFDYGWNEFKGSTSPGAERYKGVAPAGEPESAALVKLTEKIRPSVALSYHATGSILYWDYGQTGAFREECRDYVSLIADLTGYRIIYRENPDGKVDAAGYSDWMVGVKQIPAITVEIGVDRAPLAIQEFAKIWEKNRGVLAAVAASVLSKESP